MSSYSEAVAKAKATGKPLVVIFVHEGCLDCARLNEALATKPGQKAVSSAVRVKVEFSDNPELSSRYGVTLTPTFLVFDCSSGELAEVYREVGSMNVDQLSAVGKSIASLAARARKKATEATAARHDVAAGDAPATATLAADASVSASATAELASSGGETSAAATHAAAAPDSTTTASATPTPAPTKATRQATSRRRRNRSSAVAEPASQLPAQVASAYQRPQAILRRAAPRQPASSVYPPYSKAYAKSAAPAKSLARVQYEQGAYTGGAYAPAMTYSLNGATFVPASSGRGSVSAAYPPGVRAYYGYGQN